MHRFIQLRGTERHIILCVIKVNRNSMTILHTYSSRTGNYNFKFSHCRLTNVVNNYEIFCFFFVISIVNISNDIKHAHTRTDVTHATSPCDGMIRSHLGSEAIQC